ncbi:hypothetical protein AX15_000748 [Amanita polypyramis BW_CC]|nr:hypothetical protein AX15_000748 [Amanita polypyramis BW_CC]
MNRTACLRLTERCAEILLSVREEINNGGDVIGDDLLAPISKLIESFSLVYNLIHKLNHRPFIKRYLKRDDILRQISECDKALTDALGMFSISIQLRILKQVQASELQRQLDTRAILDKILSASPPSNALLLTGIENDVAVSRTSALNSSPSSPVSGSADKTSSQPTSHVQEPTLTAENFHDARLPSHILPTLREFQTRQNTLDATRDTTDLRHLLSVAVQTSNDAQMLEVLQIGRDEMPEAIKTLQRALEKLIERESPSVATVAGQAETTVLAPVPTVGNARSNFLPRRMTLKSFKGKESATLKRSKTESSSTSRATGAGSSQSTNGSRIRDTLDREFIESGLDALRRMSQGAENTLPSWTITRYEVDREVKIGVGFFSDVYKGKWRGRTVAIKVLAETTPRKLFLNEAEIWKSLHHPHVLELYGASSTAGDPPWFFVSPYAKNGSLPEYLRRVALEHGVLNSAASQSGNLGHAGGSSLSPRRSSPARDSLLRSSLTGTLTGRRDQPLGMNDVTKEWDLYRFMHEIAKGMEYLHNMKVVRGDREVFGILHGDLKAANVLVDDRLHCVISDFGQSEMKSEAYRISGMPLPHGTLRWQAPELMAGVNDLTPAMDVYAYSICCIEILLMGRVPWSLYDDHDVRRFVLEEDRRPPLPEVPPFNSPGLRELIQACWNRDPDKRPTFRQVVQEMRFIRRNAGQSPDETHTPQKPELLDDERISRHSPDPRPAPLPNSIYSRSSEEGRPHHSQKPPHIHIEGTVATEHVLYTSSEPSSRTSSLLTHAASSSEESFVLPPHNGYESPLLHDDRALERKHEMRYRLLLNHDFHPSLTLPLWRPGHVRVGAVGYLSRPSGNFVTLFNSYFPDKSEEESTRKIPSLHGYGKVDTGMQRQDKRNAAQRGFDMITGFLTFRNAESRTVGRRYSIPLRSGHKAAYLYTETTIYRYMESLNAPKRWFADNVDRILKIYAPDHPITREDLFLVIGTLNCPDYALFVSHKHPDGQAHFNVYAAPRNGQPWGTFTIDTQVSPKVGGPIYGESFSGRPSFASHVSNAGDGWNTIILARLRFKPDLPEPTSL